MRSCVLLDLDAEAVRVDVDLDHLRQHVASASGVEQALLAEPWAATMPAWMAAPRATTSLTASELSGALPVSSCEHLPRHRHVRRAADQQHAIDLLPGQARLPQHLLRRQAACASAGRASASRTRPGVSGTVSTLPACVQVMLVCGSLLSVRLARSAAAGRSASDCGSCADRCRAARWNCVGDVIDDAVVPVLAAQAHVALDGQRLEALLRQADQRHVEGAAAEIVDEHGALLAGQQRGRRAARVPPCGGWNE